MKAFLLVAAALVAVLDWLAVWKQWRRAGYIAKPLTIILLFAWLVVQTRLQGAAVWFGVGLLFSLAGDVFLLLPPSYFLFGLGAFALTHLAYLIGFFPILPTDWDVGAWGLAGVIVAYAIVVIRRVISAQLSRGLKKMTRPTCLYAVLITSMFMAAFWTQYRPDWSLVGALLVTIGAAFFYISDISNAWIRFVNPVRSGRVLVMVTYHLGQFLLMLGVVLNSRPW